MTRKPEPSFELKLIIWDLAATVGKNKPTDIQRQMDIELEKRRRKGDLFDDTPDVRTVSRIVGEINKLDPEIVIAKLPPHVWKLRDDYESIKLFSERSSQTSLKEVCSLVAKTKEEHLSESFPQIGPDYNLSRHYDDLANAATVLAANMATILSCAEFIKVVFSEELDGSDVGISGDIVRGGYAGMLCSDGRVDPLDEWWEEVRQGDEREGEETFGLQPVNSLDAKCLLEHFNYRFPNMLRFKDWHEANALNISKDVVDTLNILTRSKNFGLCPTCPVCKDMRA